MLFAFVIYTLCLVLVAGTSEYSAEEKSWIFQYFFNGELDNTEQYERDGRSYVQTRMVPIEARGLSEYLVTFAEEDVDDQGPFILSVGIFEDGPNNTFRIQLYNFTNNYSQYGAREFNYSKVADFELSDLVTDPECYAQFEIHRRDLLTGTFPDCKFLNSDGSHPRFILDFDCQHEIAVFPTNINQKAAETPYVLYPTRQRFPVPGVPDTFQSPCPDEYRLRR